MKLDVVYFVKQADINEELRYSLRSLVNLPHKKVWIVGYTPTWVTGVESIAGNVFRDKWWNVIDNLRLAALHVKATRFVIMNDDIFLMRTPNLEPTYRGPLAEQIIRSGGGPWRDSLEKTYAYLASQGFDEPISYELHTPVVMERKKLLEVAKLAMSWRSNPPQWRTLYGNLYRVGGTQATDGKIINARTQREWSDYDVLSTEDAAFRGGPVGRYIRGSFPRPGPYEGRPTLTPRKGPASRLREYRKPSPMYGLPVG